MIDAHGYDNSHTLIVICRLWNIISDILLYNKVYCVVISAWGLELLVLTRWAIPTASVVERVTGTVSTSFLLWKTTPKHFHKQPNLESIGIMTLFCYEENRLFYIYAVIYGSSFFCPIIKRTNK
jgi:hypothetical protein